MYGENPEEGVEMLREAWTTGKKVFEARHPTHLTDGANLALALLKVERIGEALAQIDVVEAAARASFSESHPVLVQMIGHRAQILQAKGDVKGAESCYLKVIQGLERASGPKNHNVIVYMMLLAKMYIGNDGLGKAEAMMPDLSKRAEGNANLTKSIEALAAEVAALRAAKKK